MNIKSNKKNNSNSELTYFYTVQQKWARRKKSILHEVRFR